MSNRNEQIEVAARKLLAILDAKRSPDGSWPSNAQIGLYCDMLDAALASSDEKNSATVAAALAREEFYKASEQRSATWKALRNPINGDRVAYEAALDAYDADVARVDAAYDAMLAAERGTWKIDSVGVCPRCASESIEDRTIDTNGDLCQHKWHFQLDTLPNIARNEQIVIGAAIAWGLNPHPDGSKASIQLEDDLQAAVDALIASIKKS